MDFERSAKIRKWTAIVLVILALSFTVFVLLRNDWAVDMDDLSGAVKNAFGLRTVEDQQRTVLIQLDVTPSEVFKQRLKNGTVVTVMMGEVQNRSKYPMEHVLLEGRLLDGSKGLRFTTAPVPCGRTADKKALAGMGSKQLAAFHMEGALPFNCAIQSGAAVPFMVVFDNLPSDVNSAFTFEVHPHFGKFVE